METASTPIVVGAGALELGLGLFITVPRPDSLPGPSKVVNQSGSNTRSDFQHRIGFPVAFSNPPKT
jgi:hypothetical protein